MTSLFSNTTARPLIYSRFVGVERCILKGSSYTEHVDFGDEISAGIVGKDQQFTVKIDGDTFVQAGTLSNGKGLSETWKRVSRER